MSLNTGYWLLGMNGLTEDEMKRSLGGMFADAWGDLWHNFFAVFTGGQTDWAHLTIFFNEVFLPYMVGGLIPGAIFGLAGYYASLPSIIAYKNRRKGMIKAKWAAIKDKATHKADAKGNSD